MKRLSILFLVMSVLVVGFWAAPALADTCTWVPSDTTATCTCLDAEGPFTMPEGIVYWENECFDAYERFGWCASDVGPDGPWQCVEQPKRKEVDEITHTCPEYGPTIVRQLSVEINEYNTGWAVRLALDPTSYVDYTFLAGDGYYHSVQFAPQSRCKIVTESHTFAEPDLYLQEAIRTVDGLGAGGNSTYDFALTMAASVAYNCNPVPICVPAIDVRREGLQDHGPGEVDQAPLLGLLRQIKARGCVTEEALRKKYDGMTLHADPRSVCARGPVSQGAIRAR